MSERNTGTGVLRHSFLNAFAGVLQIFTVGLESETTQFIVYDKIKLTS